MVSNPFGYLIEACEGIAEVAALNTIDLPPDMMNGFNMVMFFFEGFWSICLPFVVCPLLSVLGVKGMCAKL